MQVMRSVILGLLMVAASMAAIDAQAQTNSERLVSIDESTDTIQEVVNAIQEAIASIADGIANIMSGIKMLQTDMDTVVSGVGIIEEDISSASGKIDTLMASTEEITDSLDAIDERIQSLEEGDGQQDEQDRLVGLINDLTYRTNVLDSNLIDRLSSIESRLTAMEIQLLALEEEDDGDDDDDKSRPVIDYLLEGTSQRSLSSYDFKRQGDDVPTRGLTYYDLEMTFSCNNNVFLKKATMTTAFGDDDQYLIRDADHTDDQGGEPDGINYVTVEGRTLYHNWYDTAPGTQNNYIEYSTQDTSFGNRLLREGSALDFKARLYDGHFDMGQYDPDAANTEPLLINNSTRDSNTSLYTLKVEWTAQRSGTICSIGYGSDSGPVGLTAEKSLSYGVDIDSDNSILNNFSDTLDCEGEPVSITNVDTGTGDEWASSLARYAVMYMTIIDGVNDDEPDATFGFDSDGRASLSDGDLPSFADADLEITGRLPGTEGLVVRINYDTVPGVTCEIR